MTSPFPPTGSPQPPEQAPNRRRGWIVALAVLLVAAVGVIVYLLVDGDDAEPAPAASSTTATAGDEPEPSTSATTPAPTAGCAANDAAAPEGADVVTVIDVDGDDRPDQAWLSGGDTRTLGITTASGATFSTPVESASPVPASAVVNRVQDDEIPIALVDLGREALVYSLAGCAVSPVLNAEGTPYTFDRGFAGAGTGVGCTEEAGVLRLAGLDAVADAQGYTVTRTFVDLDADGRQATNAAPEQVAIGAAADDPVVTTAQEVSCGDLVAGSDAGPVEPQ